ncbi:ParB-like protein [Sphingobium sp. TKS]|nr:ParB-like protein [Sphingobium sp. TKS]
MPRASSRHWPPSAKRRYHAALIVAQEEGSVDPLPCAIMEAGDDAAALEASLIENIARLDPDEVTRWETFTRLVKEGRSPENISLTFGLTELQVKRTLVLFRPGNMLFANASPGRSFCASPWGKIYHARLPPVYHGG